MKLKLALTALSLFSLSLTAKLSAQDTFSIVAVDSATGEVGSAGASCIANSIIISDMHPGRGVIHTQAAWLNANKVYGKSQMDAGHSPDEIIDSLLLHDAAGDSTVRQYGVVDLVNGGRSAGYTGANCMDYKNHITGPYFSIQGNILLGQAILDSMESRFLNQPGPLAHKLMAALQGANVPGADTRCLANNKPAISAFVRVAKPGDTVWGYWMDLKVNNTTAAQNPIDMLQVLFDEFKLANSREIPVTGDLYFSVITKENEFKLQFHSTETAGEEMYVSVSDLSGHVVAEMQSRVTEFVDVPIPNSSNGLFVVKVQTFSGKTGFSKCVVLR